MVGERPKIRQYLHEDRDLIPNFDEECLRIEGPVNVDFLVEKKPTQLGATLPWEVRLILADNDP